MSRAERLVKPPQRGAFSPPGAVSAGPAQSIADHRPQAVTQRAAMDAVAHSPAMAAQRQAFSSLTAAAQLKTAETIQGAGGLEEELPAQAAGLEEELLQGAGLEEEEPLQGAGMEDEELQMKSAGSGEADEGAKENRTGMPDALKSGVEAMSGLSMDDVKVHRGSAKPAELNALAYAQGNDIHLGPGQEKHLPHEAWHVVQQEQGRVRPTRQMKGGVSVNDDKALELEADVMGARALSGGPVQRKAGEAEA